MLVMRLHLEAHDKPRRDSLAQTTRGALQQPRASSQEPWANMRANANLSLDKRGLAVLLRVVVATRL
jgi:hypothetical protein